MLQRLIYWAPVLAAAVLSLISWLSLPGYYAPDTTTFLGQTAHFGDPNEWHITAPLYPMILDRIGLMLAPEFRVPTLVGIQLFFSVVLASLAALLGGKWLGQERAGWWAAWGAALYGQSFLIAHSLQTEALFTGLTAVTLLFAAGAMAPASAGPRRWVFAALAGLVGGLAMAERSVGLATLLVIPCALLWFAVFSRGTEAGYKKIVRPLGQAALLGLAAALVIGAMKSRNARVFGEGSFTTGAGLHLYNRVSHSYETIPASPVFDRVEEIARRHGVEHPHAPNAGFEVFAALRWQEGLSATETDTLMADVAKAALLQNLPHTAVETLQMMAESSRWNDPFNKWATLFMTDGIRPEHFDKHIESCEFWWQSGLVQLHQGLADFPPYSARGWLGSWLYPVFEGLAYLSCLWSGWWVVAVGLLGFAVSLISGNRGAVLGFGISMGILGASAFGEAPQIRFWVVCVPSFIFGFACLVIGSWDKVVSAHRADHGNS